MKTRLLLFFCLVSVSCCLFGADPMPQASGMNKDTATQADANLTNGSGQSLQSITTAKPSIPEGDAQIRVPADSYEPDDTAGQFTSLALSPYDQYQDHTLHSSTDVDWYGFAAYAGRTYEFYSVSTADVRVFLYDQSLTMLLWDDDGNGYPNFHLAFQCTVSGFYYLKVDGYGGSEGGYQFHYYFSITPDAYEPDDTYSLSQGILPTDSEQIQEHTIHSDTDYDWYWFWGYADVTYHFYSTGTELDTYAELYIYSDANMLVSDDDGMGYPNFDLQYTAQTSAYYYLRVRGVAGNQGPYGLVYYAYIAPDTYEPDDSSAACVNIFPTPTVQNQVHTLDSYSDEDWFVFMGVPGRIYQFYSQGTCDTYACLFEDDGVTEIDSDDDNGYSTNFQLEFSSLELANYKLRVTSFNGQMGYYTLCYSIGALADIWEPDNTASQYTSITVNVGSTIEQRSLHSTTDQDWLRFQAQPGYLYRFYSLGYTDTYIRIFEDDGTTLLVADDDSVVDYNFDLLFSPPVSTGYFKVQISGSGGNVGDYQLVYFLERAQDAYEPDDLSSQSTTLSVNGLLQNQIHSLHNLWDEDWYRFYGYSGRTYNLYSLGPAHTEATLLSDDLNTTFWAGEHGIAPDYNFQMSFNPPYTGYFRLRIKSYWTAPLENSIGVYTICYQSPLPTPEDLMIIRTGSTIRLDWSPVPGVAGYKVESSNYPDSGFSQQSIVTGTWWQTSASQPRKYYRIRAIE